MKRKYLDISAGQSCLEWHDLEYSVERWDGQSVLPLRYSQTDILCRVSGEAYPGEILAIMGPSGSGKTSLINILAGRQVVSSRRALLSGQVLLGGKERDKKTWRQRCGVVEQQDHLQEHLSVIETLLFTAHLRLSKRLPVELKQQRVSRLLSELGLLTCADTLICNISGGERKRVSLAIEMITSPDCLFLDEPTSGLDSFTALSLLESLYKLACQEQKMIIMSIHQPRELMLQYISRIMLLSQGSVIFQGSVEEALIYFSHLGLHCPSLTNPADFLIDNITMDNRSVEMKFISQRRINLLKDEWERQCSEIETVLEQRSNVVVLGSIRQAQVHAKKRVVSLWSERPGILFQVKELSLRYLTDYRRYKAALVALTVQTVLLSAFVSAIFWQVGYSQASIQNRLGLLFFIVAQEMFSFTMPVATALPSEKALIVRERYAASYRAISVYLAKAGSIIPQAIISVSVFSTVVYWCAGLSTSLSSFTIFMTTMITLVCCSQALGLLIGSLSPNSHVSLIMGPLILLIFALFGGNTVNTTQVPAFISWIQYISPANYAYRALMLNEFAGLTFVCDSTAPGAKPCFSDGAQVLEFYNLTGIPIWADIIILVALCAVFHVLALNLVASNIVASPSDHPTNDTNCEINSKSMQQGPNDNDNSIKKSNESSVNKSSRIANNRPSNIRIVLPSSSSRQRNGAESPGILSPSAIVSPGLPSALAPTSAVIGQQRLMSPLHFRQHQPQPHIQRQHSRQPSTLHQLSQPSRNATRSQSPIRGDFESILQMLPMFRVFSPTEDHEPEQTFPQPDTSYSRTHTQLPSYSQRSPEYDFTQDYLGYDMEQPPASAMILSPISHYSPDSNTQSPIAEKDISDSSFSIEKTLGTMTDLDKAGKVEMVSFSALYSYADPTDLFLMALGTLAELAFGGVVAIVPFLYGFFLESFVNELSGAIGVEQFYKEVDYYAMIFGIICGVAFVSGFVGNYCWITTGYRQYNRILLDYFQKLLKQDISWLDMQEVSKNGQTPVELINESKNIQAAISVPVGVIVKNTSTLLTSTGLAFYINAKLAAVMFATLPVLSLVTALLRRFVDPKIRAMQEAKTSEIQSVTEIVKNIKSVHSFNAQDSEQERYEKISLDRMNLARQMHFRWALYLLLVNFFMISSYSVSYWYGGLLVSLGEIKAATVLQIFALANICFGSIFAIMQKFPELSEARSTMAKIRNIMNQKPKISIEAEGLKLEENQLFGRISFDSVSFSYPARPDVAVLKDFSLDIAPGQTIALVGSSGSGKSTIAQLIERFYDPLQGSVFLDGKDIKEYDLKWLRKQISIVSQEPSLYDVTIRENLCLCDTEKSYTDDQIVKACKLAGIHDFIMNLPNGYDSSIGDTGDQLSGGQRQRLMIARALLKDSKILILDEATSNLDLEKEREIQNFLRTHLRNKTIIIIAHRLSTIQDADLICVLENGELVEKGTHKDLLRIPNGRYSILASERQSSAVQLLSPLSPRSRIELPLYDQDRNRRQSMFSESHSVASTVFEKANVTRRVISKIVSQGKVNKFTVFIACIGGMLFGTTQPLYAVLFSFTISSYNDTDPAKVLSNTIFFSLLYLALAAYRGLTVFMRSISAGFSAVRFSHSLRIKTFRAVIGMKIPWFDEENHSSSVMGVRVCDDPDFVRLIFSSVIPETIEHATTFIAGATVALIAGWKLALVTLACFPVIVIGGRLVLYAQNGVETRIAKQYENCGKYAKEFVDTIRVVNAFNLHDYATALFRAAVSKPYSESRMSTLLVSLGAGIAESLIFGCEAIVLYAGARIFISDNYSLNQFLLVFSAIIFTATAMSSVTTIGPNFSKAYAAATRLLPLYPVPVSQSNDKNKKLNFKRGDLIEFRDVHFFYPTRPTVPVLKGVSLQIRHGQKVAIVGPRYRHLHLNLVTYKCSGSGKTTIFQLLERFYRQSAGNIILSSHSIRNYNVDSLRSNISWLTQQPLLLNRSILENIAFGSKFPNEETMRTSVIEAAKKAQVHDFIQSLPDNYKTLVGDRGTQLSGGERQRIALARCFLRDTPIFLLDEHTSALDNDNDAKITQAIKSMTQNKTIITIAHKLSSLKDADMIFVLKHGELVESGKHAELIAKNGEYAKLVNSS